MSGLLSDVLPWIYGRSNAVKRQIGGLLSDPSAYMAQSAGALTDAARDQQSLNDQAFSNKSNPLQITDKVAFGRLADLALSGVGNFAPVGMISKTTGATTNIADAKEFAELVQKTRKGLLANIIEDRGGSVYVTVSQAPLTKSGEIAKRRNPSPLGFKARFADHPQYYSADVSSDPITQNTVQDVYNAFVKKAIDKNAPQTKPPVDAYFYPGEGFGKLTEAHLRGQKPSWSGKSMVDDWFLEERPFTMINSGR